jgi:hypothetical protein
MASVVKSNLSLCGSSCPIWNLNAGISFDKDGEKHQYEFNELIIKIEKVSLDVLEQNNCFHNLKEKYNPKSKNDHEIKLLLQSVEKIINAQTEFSKRISYALEKFPAALTVNQHAKFMEILKLLREKQSFYDEAIIFKHNVEVHYNKLCEGWLCIIL